MLDAPWRPYASPVLVELPSVALDPSKTYSGTTYVDPAVVWRLEKITGYSYPVTRVIYMTGETANHIDIPMTVEEVKRRFTAALTIPPAPTLRRETVQKIQMEILAAGRRGEDFTNIDVICDVLHDAGLRIIPWEYREVLE